MTATATKNHARDVALSTAAHIERLIRLRDSCNNSNHHDWAEDIQQQIDEMPLTVDLVRSDEDNPDQDGNIVGYEILLCTGGPAVRIIGPLTSYDEPDDALLQCQDWFTPWQPVTVPHTTQMALQDFARSFYFGG